MNFITILGRQPELSLAELEQRFGSPNVHQYSDIAATVKTDRFDIQSIGGTVKAGRVIAELDKADWMRLSRDIVQRYAREFRGDGKLTLGISVYGRDVPERDVQRTGIALKSALKKHGRSVRLIPNDGTALSTATSHHNKLGLSDNKVELLVVYGPKSVIVAESVGTQNITALAARDQGRPKRDAFVGMLPPKLALMMVNLAGGRWQMEDGKKEADSHIPYSNSQTILDPFCGTGVLLQEAALLGFDVYGTDLAEKMVDYSKANMEWLAVKYHVGSMRIESGDATEHTWQQPIDAVVAETYLGQPFSAPPASDKLDKVVKVTNEIITKFLTNIGEQLAPGTPLCLAVPAWRDAHGWITFLPVIKKLEDLGYEWQSLETTDVTKLLYYREDQVVARQLLLLRRS